MTSSLSAIHTPPKRTRMRRRNGSAYKSFLGSGSGTRNRPIVFGDSGPCCHESPMVLPSLLRLKINYDVCVWLRATNKHISRCGLFEWLRMIANRSANQTCHASVADASPARPSHWNVTRFSEFEQTLELRVPGNGDPTPGERNCWTRPCWPLWSMRSMNHLRHPWCNRVQSAKDFHM